MKKHLFLAMMLSLVACGDQTGDVAKEAGDAGAAQTSSQGVANAIQFVKTQDGSSLQIDAAKFDTPAAKEFLATGKNPYIGNEEAIKEGRKKYNLYSCQACHGGAAEGAVGPSLEGPNFRYAKNASNKGMFETIWNGTNGGMGGKGFGIMAADDGLSVDELLKVVAFVRSNSVITGNE